MALISSSTLSNQNLATELLLGTFTAATDYARFKVVVYLDQITGNGNYIFRITHQRTGAGSAYSTVKTTEAVASGVTAHKAVTVDFPVANTDVVKVYVTGVSGDTTTPDTIVEWHSLDDPTASAIATAVKAAAVADPLEANIKELNDTVLSGAGVVGNKWRPT